MRDRSVESECENRDLILDSGLIIGTISSSLLSSKLAGISGKAGNSNSGDCPLSPTSSSVSSPHGGSTLSSISSSTPSSSGIPSANKTESSGAISTDHFRGVLPLFLMLRGLDSGVDARSFPLREGEVGALAKYVSRCDR